MDKSVLEAGIGQVFWWGCSTSFPHRLLPAGEGFPWKALVDALMPDLKTNFKIGHQDISHSR